MNSSSASKNLEIQSAVRCTRTRRPQRPCGRSRGAAAAAGAAAAEPAAHPRRDARLVHLQLDRPRLDFAVRPIPDHACSSPARRRRTEVVRAAAAPARPARPARFRSPRSRPARRSAAPARLHPCRDEIGALDERPDSPAATESARSSTMIAHVEVLQRSTTPRLTGSRAACRRARCRRGTLSAVAVDDRTAMFERLHHERRIRDVDRDRQIHHRARLRRLLQPAARHRAHLRRARRPGDRPVRVFQRQRAPG